jgi:hypothetical protein
MFDLAKVIGRKSLEERQGYSLFVDVSAFIMIPNPSCRSASHVNPLAMISRVIVSLCSGEQREVARTGHVAQSYA